MNKTVEIGGVRVTVRRRTVKDRLQERMVLIALNNDGSSYPARLFARFVAQTESVEGDLGFPWPDTAASDDELRAAFAAWMDFGDMDVFEAWEDALYTVDRVHTEPELRPDADEKN